MNEIDEQRFVDEYAKHYLPLITFKEAAEISHLAVATLYDLSSRGAFDHIRTRKGKGARLDRDGFVRWFVRRGREGAAEPARSSCAPRAQDSTADHAE